MDEKAKEKYTKVAFDALKPFLSGSVRDPKEFSRLYSCGSPKAVVNTVSSYVSDWWGGSPGIVEKMPPDERGKILLNNISGAVGVVAKELSLPPAAKEHMLAQAYNPVAQRYGLKKLPEKKAEKQE